MTDKEKIKELEDRVASLWQQVELVTALSEKRRQDISLLLNTIDKLESRLALGDA